MAFIVDASVVAAWALHDEQSDAADQLLVRAVMEGIVSPALLWYEIRNILLVAERRNRITPRDSNAFLDNLEKIPWLSDMPRESGHTMRLARAHKLTAYDAAYLELALRSNLHLATFDQPLARAAATEGVTVYPRDSGSDPRAAAS